MAPASDLARRIASGEVALVEDADEELDLGLVVGGRSGTLRARLLDIQRPDGTWPNDVGPGEEFSTAMACLILEIPYSFLPIFQR